MLPFTLYLLAGCLTGFQVLALVAFVAWGRPVAIREVASLLGSFSLIGLAFYSLFRLKRAAWGAFVASIWILLGYYGFAMNAAIKNIAQFGAAYPLRSFTPIILLLLTLVYSVLTIRKTDMRDSHALPRRRWIAVLLLGLFVFIASPFVIGGRFGNPPIDFFVPRKVVTVPMSWTLVHFPPGQPGFIRLETACANNRDARCVCGMDFRVTTSAEFTNYIQSFKERPIPVRYENFYDASGEVVSANLVSVGDRPNTLFHTNEQGIGAGERGDGSGESISLRTPQDCFSPLKVGH